MAQQQLPASQEDDRLPGIPWLEWREGERRVLSGEELEEGNFQSTMRKYVSFLVIMNLESF